MRGAVLHAPGDVRVEERADTEIVEPTDAVIRLSATCNVFDLTLPLKDAAEGYRAMDERRAIKTWPQVGRRAGSVHRRGR